MKLNRFFVALCAFAALGVSCAKETAPVDSQNNIVVPEGKKYVSFEIGAPTKITGSGNEIKWTSQSESISVLGTLNGESINYEFTANPDKVLSASTTKISGVVDADAVLKYVVFPYKESTKIDKDGNIIANFSAGFDYAQANSVASKSPFACKIIKNDEVYSAASSLKPLFSFLKVNLLARGANDQIKKEGTKNPAAKPTSHVKKFYVTGKGIAGDVKINFSEDDPVTSIFDDQQESITIENTVKIDSQSNLPAAGAFYVPIIPGSVDGLEFKLVFMAGSDGVEYADYSVTLDKQNNFTQGQYFGIDLNAPFVNAVSTTSASVADNKLTLTGSADVLIGGPIELPAYVFGFSYREKGAEDWKDVTGTYDESSKVITKDLTKADGIDLSKAYEVKAYAVALKTLKGGSDQKKEGTVVKTDDLPIVVTINTFGNVEYDGTSQGGCWKFKGDRTDYTFPYNTVKRRGSEDEYDYYAKNTDPAPLVSGIVILDKSTKSNQGYNFNKTYLMQYSGWIKIPGLEGYKITNVDVTMHASSGSGKGVNVTKDTSEDRNTDVLGKTSDYTKTDKSPELLSASLSGSESGKGVKLWPRAPLYFDGIEITYTPVSE